MGDYMTKLIKKDIKNKKKQEKLEYWHPTNLGNKLYTISVNSHKYRVSNAIFMGVLSALLIATLVRFLFILHNWLTISISSIAIVLCVVWMILAIKRSLIKVEYTLYENYIVKSFEDWDDYADHLKYTGYKISTTLIDKLFKPRTSTIYLFYDDKRLPYLKLSCIEEDAQKVADIILDAIKARQKKAE